MIMTIVNWLIKILTYLSEKKEFSASLSELSKLTGIPVTTAKYRVDVLCRKGLLKHAGRGVYMLARVTPYALLGGKAKTIHYIGLLGLKTEDEPVFSVAHRALMKLGYQVSNMTVFTSPQAIESWSQSFNDINFRLINYDTLVDYHSSLKTLKNFLESATKRELVFTDLTSGPRPAALAMYDISRKLLVPSFYISISGRFIWIRSPENVLREAIQYLGTIFRRK